MNSKASIWSDLPLSAGIATLVCYAGVFNDVIGIEEIAARLGVSERDAFYAALNELHLKGKIVLNDGFAALPSLEDKIAVKASKIATARKLINSRLACLNKIAKNPIVKFVGISGSLAASNPVRDRNNHLDIDIFLITRSQCLWLYNILRGLRYIFPRSKQEPELCISYVMDERILLVPNRNFYTATEIKNLIPVSGLEVYSEFLRVNSWVNYYYTGMSDATAPVGKSFSSGWVDKLFYVVYNICRSIKWRRIDILRNISFGVDQHASICLQQLKTPYGGYQALVQKKLSRLGKEWFPELLDNELIKKLFPDELSAEIMRGDINVHKILADAGVGYDYSKYG
ncbi:MAG: hypothetical protein QM715_02270 [Nibricoccus sp.]